MDSFLNQLIQCYSSNATNLHHLTQYAVLPHNIEIVLWPQITLTSLTLCLEEDRASVAGIEGSAAVMPINVHMLVITAAR